MVLLASLKKIPKCLQPEYLFVLLNQLMAEYIVFAETTVVVFSFCLGKRIRLSGLFVAILEAL